MSVYRVLAYIKHNLVTGEDSADMSAAGQMETYLGIKGLQQVEYIILV